MTDQQDDRRTDYERCGFCRWALVPRGAMIICGNRNSEFREEPVDHDGYCPEWCAGDPV